MKKLESRDKRVILSDPTPPPKLHRKGILGIATVAGLWRRSFSVSALRLEIEITTLNFWHFFHFSLPHQIQLLFLLPHCHWPLFRYSFSSLFQFLSLSLSRARFSFNCRCSSIQFIIIVPDRVLFCFLSYESTSNFCNWYYCLIFLFEFASL